MTPVLADRGPHLAAAAHRQGFTAGLLDLPDGSADWGADLAAVYRRGLRDGRARRSDDALPAWTPDWPGLTDT